MPAIVKSTVGATVSGSGVGSAESEEQEQKIPTASKSSIVERKKFI